MNIFYDDQKEYEDSFRTMWSSIFEDPKEYEDFYFQNMYRKNKVLAMQQQEEIAGMLHLNPYTLSVDRRDYPLHYIVGVATLAKCRRQGIMRMLLEKAMRDMAENGEIFTYLMPADRAYYEPFDFAFVQKYETKLLTGNGKVSKLEVLAKSQYEEAAQFVNEYCKKHTCVFTKFDLEYMRQLYEEVTCEDGEILCLKMNGRITGFCCYGQDDEKVYVRQLFCEDMELLEDEIRAYFSQKEIELTFDGRESGNGAAIMARILRLDLLIPLLNGREESEILIHIEDKILAEQNGTFHIIIGKDRCQIQRIDVKAEKSITIWDLTKIIFGFECETLLQQYPELKPLIPLQPVMIGEII
jgi:predicted acetyltransferase